MERIFREFCQQETLSYCRDLSHAVKPYDMGTSGFISPPKEGVLQDIYRLKSPSHRPGLNQRTSGPMASTLIITPPRLLSLEFRNWFRDYHTSGVD
jgi:hypothetical protein